MIPKPDKDTRRKENWKEVLMNIDSKALKNRDYNPVIGKKHNGQTRFTLGS